LKETAFVAALRSSGLTALTAVDSPLFVAHVEQQLVPTLHTGDVVVMDNLSVYKVTDVRAAIEKVGARLVYLPPYSPDINPIEQALAKLKWLLRSAKERTVEGLWELLGKLAEHFSPNECRNYFRYSGYATPPGRSL